MMTYMLVLIEPVLGDAVVGAVVGADAILSYLILIYVYFYGGS
jgi:hypothetical protein